MKKDSLPIRPTQARGFTLLELMVAMSITVILLGIVTYLTSMSMDTYKKSRDQVRSARQAKEALDAIGKDFQAMVARSDGSSTMWLYAAVEPQLVGDTVGGESLVGPANKKITNASRLIFFTGAADRYGGDIGGTGDNGGDVSAVGYRLVYRDQISGTAAGQVGTYPVFTLYRHIVNPDDAFTNALGYKNAFDEYDLSSSPEFTDANDFVAENVLVENIYEMTVTFLVQSTTGIARITMGYEATEQAPAGPYHALSLKGNGIYALDADPGNTPIRDADWGDAIDGGQLVGVEISITVLSDQGLVLAQKSGIPRGEIIEEYGYHFTKTINVPRL